MNKDDVSLETGWSIRKTDRTYRVLIWEKNVTGFRNIHVIIDEDSFNTLVVRCTSGSIDFFVNGVFNKSELTQGVAIQPSDRNIRLSGSQSLASIKIYNSPVTPEEIAHNYAIEKERFNI